MPTHWGTKYNARKTVFNGRRFDSKAEADRASELLDTEKCEAISNLGFQPRLELEPGIYYKPDFIYKEKHRWVYEDVKGFETERFRLICKIWRNHGPGLLRVTKRRNARERFRIVREIAGGQDEG